MPGPRYSPAAPAKARSLGPKFVNQLASTMSSKSAASSTAVGKLGRMKGISVGMSSSALNAHRPGSRGGNAISTVVDWIEVGHIFPQRHGGTANTFRDLLTLPLLCLGCLPYHDSCGHCAARQLRAVTP